MRSRNAYKAVLRLYPVDFRARFEHEMVAVFECRLSERRGQGWPALSSVVCRELLSAACGAAAEWAAKLTSRCASRSRCLPDIRMMRPPGVGKADWYRGL
jgi:hypothetical protein